MLSGQHKGLLAFFLFIIVFMGMYPRVLSNTSSEPNPSAVVTEVAVADKQQLVRFIVETYKQKPALATRIVNAAFKESRKTDLSPLLLLAVMAQESSFVPSVKNSYGAQGLMQVVGKIHAKEVAKLKHPKKLFHPESNIAIGAKILQTYVQQAHGNVDEALARYSGQATEYPKHIRKHWRTFAVVSTKAKSVVA